MTAFVVSGRYTFTLNFGSYDSLLLTQTGVIDVASGNGIFSNGLNNSLTIDGQVIARTGIGVSLFGFTNINVGATGSIFGGIRSQEFISLNNSGNIAGESGVSSAAAYSFVQNSGAIYASAGDGIGLNGTVVNSGLIQAPGFGTGVFTRGVNNSITNYGTIEGGYAGVVSQDGTTGFTNIIVNHGSIIGYTLVGVGTRECIDVVINNGFIYGNTAAVELGASGDFYDGRGGTLNGSVLGGTGDDVLYGGVASDILRGGDQNDQLNGGGGSDTLDGGSGYDFARYDFGGAVTVSLVNSASNAGDAAGDILTSIEGLAGSNGADTLIGDSVGNTFYGLGGNDAISGGDGADAIYGDGGADILFGEDGIDTIFGGAGGDIIRGGLGGDIFAYNLNDQGDTIQNFNEGGYRDVFDMRPLFDSTGYTKANPRGDGILAVLQNGADTDVYIYGVFFFRIEGVTAGAIDDTYFLFQ